MGNCTSAIISEKFEKQFCNQNNIEDQNEQILKAKNTNAINHKFNNNFKNLDDKKIYEICYASNFIQKISRGFLFRKSFKKLYFSKNLKFSNKISENSYRNNLVKHGTDSRNFNKFSNRQNVSENEKKVFMEIQIDKHRFYKGEVVKDIRTGIGHLTWDDGTQYLGLFRENKANGFGKLIHKEGDIYIGNWLEDKASGPGKYFNKDNSSYEGFWQSDKQQGYGIEINNKGTLYEGSYEKGYKFGLGTLIFEDTSSYEGEFIHNEMTGIGKFIFRDKRVYEGEWNGNKMHGYGIITWPNGKVFEGSFVNDKKEGFGIYFNHNKIYICYWKNSKLHGVVTIIEKGLIKKSFWDEGSRIASLGDDKPLSDDRNLMELVNKNPCLCS